MFKTESMRDPVGFSLKSFLDLCEPRKVNPWYWKRCLFQGWCRWVLYLCQAGLALEWPKQRTNIQESCPAPAGNREGGGSWAFQSWLFLQCARVVLVFSLSDSVRSLQSLWMGISNCRLHPEACFVKIMSPVSSVPGESMGRLLLWLPLTLLPDLHWKGGGRDRKSIPWQFSYWKMKSNTGKRGLKKNIFLLVTGSCIGDKFDSLSCSEIASSLEHVLLFVCDLGTCLFQFQRVLLLALPEASHRPFLSL